MIAHIGLADLRWQPRGRVVGGLAKRTHLCRIAREFPGRRTRGASNRGVLSSGYRLRSSHRWRGEYLKGAPRQGMDCDWRTQDGTSFLDPCTLLLRKARYSSLQLVLCHVVFVRGRNRSLRRQCGRRLQPARRLRAACGGVARVKCRTRPLQMKNTIQERNRCWGPPGCSAPGDGRGVSQMERHINSSIAGEDRS